MHIIIPHKLNFQLLSKYRTLLMGVGILGVLSGHFFSLSGITPSNFVALFISKFYILVFTQGFLFLSGLGLFFSYSNNSNILHFYGRRIRRLYIPYVLMTTPFFVFQDFFICQPNILKFMGHITSLGYWTNEGNFNGLWYIAVTFVLYAIYPLVHKLVFTGKDFFCVLFAWFVLMTVVSAINVTIMRYAQEFYSSHNLCIEQYSIFFVGMLTGYILQRKKISFQFVLPIIFVVSFVVQRQAPELNFLYEPMKKVCIYMPLICLFFYLFDSRIKIVHRLKIALDWMGNYSLELYVLQSILYCFMMRLNVGFIDSTVSISSAILISLALCQPIHLLFNKIVRKPRMK